MEYGDAGRGVALSFNLQRIRPPVDIGSSVTFAPCLYMTQEKGRMIEDALSDWVNVAYGLHKLTGSRQWAAERLRDWLLVDRVFGTPFDRAALLESNKEEFRKQLHESLTRTAFDLLRIASHCKDESFRQEAEWRLALPHIKGKPMKTLEIQHRGSKGAIPYVAHDLFSKRLPLVRIKTGPICEKMDQINDLLKQCGYDVPVERSTIPIRSAESIRQ